MTQDLILPRHKRVGLFVLALGCTNDLSDCGIMPSFRTTPALSL